MISCKLLIPHQRRVAIEGKNSLTMSEQPDYEQLGRELVAYCKKYNIGLEDFFPILNDQKVIPMLRGKAAEYGAVLALRRILNPQIWVVNKLNLNAQPGTTDHDIDVIHRRTDVRIIVEIKSAVRGSMSSGVRTRKHNVPHFEVKCHRSRSNMGLSYNDRYLAKEFDIIVTTPTNALYKGGTVGEEFEIVSEEGLLGILYKYYGIADIQALIDATNDDWRFAQTASIAETTSDGYAVIPRTPSILLENDPNWQPLNQIQLVLESIVKAKVQARSRRS